MYDVNEYFQHIRQESHMSKFQRTFVISDHGPGGISIWADESQRLDGRGVEGKSIIEVLEENNALTSCVTSELLVLRRAHVLRAEFAVGGEIPRISIEEAETHQDHEAVGYCVVHLGLRHLAALDGRQRVAWQERSAIEVKPCDMLLVNHKILY